MRSYVVLTDRDGANGTAVESGSGADAWHGVIGGSPTPPAAAWEVRTNADIADVCRMPERSRHTTVHAQIGGTVTRITLRAARAIVVGGRADA